MTSSTGSEPADDAVFDVSGVEQMSDVELRDRHREILRVERERFHQDLSPMFFLAHVSHLQNSALEDARWAVERELRRRGQRANGD